jgi:purine-binding chemotaxis protein CheW
MPHYGSTNRDPLKTDVLFTVGDVHYAIAISQVAELVTPLSVTHLPHSPPEISGIADHRGVVIPVLDLRAYFALPPSTSTRTTRWILVNIGQRLVGLVVDRVIEVVGLKSEDIRQAGGASATRDRRGISTVTHYNGVLVFIIDVKRFNEIVEDVADILPIYEG